MKRHGWNPCQCSTLADDPHDVFHCKIAKGDLAGPRARHAQHGQSSRLFRNADALPGHGGGHKPRRVCSPGDDASGRDSRLLCALPAGRYFVAVAVLAAGPPHAFGPASFRRQPECLRRLGNDAFTDGRISPRLSFASKRMGILADAGCALYYSYLLCFFQWLWPLLCLCSAGRSNR